MFSPVYIDLYSKSRSGKVDAFEELVRMSDEGDNLAKGYQAMIFQRSSILIVPKNKPRAKILLEEIIPWLFEKEYDDVYDAAHVWYLLGFCYYEAIGIGKQDKNKAVHYYKLSFDKGHALAQCALGNCYDVGDGVKRDLKKALEYYELSADQGFPVAQSNTGMCYEYGEGCDVNLQLAVEYTEKAAEQGYVDALYNLAMYYFYGKGVEADSEKGMDFCQQGAAQGDLECLYILGDCYLRGYDVQKDEKKGFDYILSAANRNHDLSLVYVAELYYKGTGVDENVVEAVRYLRRAIARSDNDEVDDFCKDQKLLPHAKDLLRAYEEEYRAQVSLMHCFVLIWRGIRQNKI